MEKSREYWSGRMQALEDEQYRRSEAYYRDVQKQFRMAANNLQMEIDRWYDRLAENNGVSYASAKKFLKTSELEEFKWTVEDYIKAGRENGCKDEGKQMNWEDNVRKVVPYTPGEQPSYRKMIKLNTNECPYPPSPKVREVLQNFDADRLRLYPDPAASELVEALAARCGLKKEQIFVGVGSDEVLALSFLAFFAGKKPVLPQPISLFCTMRGIGYGLHRMVRRTQRNTMVI